jgi:hypothetical protein
MLQIRNAQGDGELNRRDRISIDALGTSDKSIGCGGLVIKVEDRYLPLNAESRRCEWICRSPNPLLYLKSQRQQKYCRAAKTDPESGSFIASKIGSEAYTDNYSTDTEHPFNERHVFSLRDIETAVGLGLAVGLSIGFFGGLAFAIRWGNR